MIISRTPLRISFMGGGSDLKSYYEHSYGAVISTSIDKYIYITVNKKFDNKIRASYSVTEMVDKVDDLKHQLIRESLKLQNIRNGIEITSISDIPSSGTGLGSSSTYTVGLINALKAYKGEAASPGYLAGSACKIEIDKCGEPIGKQDQYAAAFGGFNYLRFNSNGSVDVEPIVCKKSTIEELEKSMLMLYTGINRSASTILKNQDENTKNHSDKRGVLKEMVGLADKARDLLSKGNVEEFGELLHENWELKKKMSSGISTEKIDSWYKSARKNGAIGGKILGAGGGGFLLLIAPPEKHAKIKKSLKDMRVVNAKFEPFGSKIIFFQS